MKIIYSPEAELELTEAAVYLAESSGSIELGERLLRDAALCEQRIAERPGAWPPVARNCPRYLVTTFPYQIIYRVEGDTVRIYAFAYVKRRPGYWTKRLAR